MTALGVVLICLMFIIAIVHSAVLVMTRWHVHSRRWLRIHNGMLGWNTAGFWLMGVRRVTALMLDEYPWLAPWDRLILPLAITLCFLAGTGFGIHRIAGLDISESGNIAP